MASDDMTDTARRALAERLRTEERVRFKGLALNAYRTAGVNAGTWARLLTGQSVKPRTVIQVVGNLWPEAEGDWRQVPGLTLDEDPVVSAITRSQLPRSAQADLIGHYETLLAATKTG